MLKERFFDAARDLFDTIQKEESGNISNAAKLISAAVLLSKTVFLYDRGHLLGGELLCRAGGAAFIRRLDYSLPDPAMRSPNTGSREKRLMNFTGSEKDAAVNAFEDVYAEYLMKANDLGEGDALIINSVSGKGHAATALAGAAKKRGLSLIVISSRVAAESIQPDGGGKRLIDYADVLIDNHAPFGDAMFELPGIEEKVCPASGIAAAAIGWAMVAEALELIVAGGVSPTVYRSVNIPGGPEQNAAAFARYTELGY